MAQKFEVIHNGITYSWFMQISLLTKNVETVCVEWEGIVITSAVQNVEQNVKLVEATITVPELSVTYPFAADLDIALLMNSDESVSRQILTAAAKLGLISNSVPDMSLVQSTMSPVMSPCAKRFKPEHNPNSRAKCNLGFGTTGQNVEEPSESKRVENVGLDESDVAGISEGISKCSPFKRPQEVKKIFEAPSEDFLKDFQILGDESTALKFSNFVPPFDKDMFLFFVEQTVIAQEKGEEGKIVQTCSDLQLQDMSVVVEFQESSALDVFLDCESVQYLYENLTVTKIVKKQAPKISSKVKILNVQNPFSKDKFQTFIETTLVRSKPTLCAQNLIKFCSDRNEKENSVIVEFEEPGLAHLIHSIQPINFLFRKLSVEYIEESIEQDNKVVQRVMAEDPPEVTQDPAEGSQGALVVAQDPPVGRQGPPAVAQDPLLSPKEDHTASVGSSELFIPDDMLDVNNLFADFGDDLLSESTPSNGSTEKAFIPYVKILGIPKPLVKELFIQFLQAFLEAQCEDLKGVTGLIRSCSNFNDSDNSVVVECDDVCTAQLLLALQPIKYLYHALEVVLMEKKDKVPSEAIDSDLICKRVRIGNVVRPFDPALFTIFLKGAMVEANLCASTDNAAFTLLPFNEQDRSVDVVFEDPAVAEQLQTKCAGAQYFFQTVTFQSIFDGSPDESEFTDNECDVQGDSVPDSSTLVPSIPVGVKTRNDWTNYTTLKLLELAISNRHLLLHKSTHKQHEGWNAVWGGMLKCNLYYTLKKIKSTLKMLILSLPTQKVDWMYRKPVQEYLGQSPPGSSNIKQLLEKCKERCDNSTKVVETNNRKEHYGIVIVDNHIIEDVDSDRFTEASTMLLIAEYKERKHLFDDAQHRSAAIYNKILAVMHKHGYVHLTTTDLSKRMGWLAQQFKTRYDKVLNNTGSSAEALNWKYYDVMALLLEGSAVLQPQKLRAFGTQVMDQVRAPREVEAESHACEKKPNTSQAGKGKKPSADKFLKPSPSTYKGKKIEIAQNFLGQFTKMTDVVSGLLRTEDKGS